VAVVVSGSCCRWQLFGWQLSGWQLFGWQFPWAAVVLGGSCRVGSSPVWQLSYAAVFLGGSCPRWQLSWAAVVLGGNCRRWQLSRMAIVVGGSCGRWQLSGWQLSRMAIVLCGSFPAGRCPGDYCPRTVLPTSRRHTTGFFLKRCWESCESTMLTAAYYWPSSHCIPGHAVMGVTRERQGGHNSPGAESLWVLWGAPNDCGVTKKS